MTSLVSVVMPAFNVEPFIGSAIESILSQTYQAWELIVIDDGSIDATAQLVSDYQDPRIRLHSMSENQGLASARNAGLAKVRGSLVAWLDADDLSHPRRLERQVNALSRWPEVGMCGTWVQTFGSSPPMTWRYPTDPDTVRCRMVFDDPLATSSTMMRRECLEGLANGFDSSMAPAEDYDMWERITRRWPAMNLGRTLTNYRLHASQTSIVNSESQVRAVLAIQGRQLESMGIKPTERELAIHLEIGVRWNFTADVGDVDEIAAWLERLRVANREAQSYPQSAFMRVLEDRWNRVLRGHGRRFAGLFKSSIRRIPTRY